VPPRRYTEQEFRTAVEDPGVRTMADLCRALGVVPRGANYETLRAFAADLQVDLDGALQAGRRRAPRRMTRRSYEDADLLAAIGKADGYPALCELLGLSPRSGTYRRLRDRAASLGHPLPSEWSRPGRRSSASPATQAPRPITWTDHQQISEEEIRAAIADARCLADALRALGEQPSGQGYRRLKRAIARHGIDTAHFDRDATRGGTRRRPLDGLLVAGSRVNSTGLRRRLLEEGVKPHQCEGCARTVWRGQPIPLELDHLNGDRTDNRLENLRLLCPNCHALTPTYRGRNIGRRGIDDGHPDADLGARCRRRAPGPRI
jgi:5-methylcytosine-specific restriction endonuclease McrA